MSIPLKNCIKSIRNTFEAAYCSGITARVCVQGKVLAGGGLCKKRPEAAPCWTDPLLAQAEPTSGTSVMTNLEKDKKPVQHLWERNEKTWENQPCRCQGQWRRKGWSSAGTRAEIPLQPIEKTMTMQVVLLQPVEYHSGANIHSAAHGEHQTRTRGGALKETAAHGEPRLEQAPDRSHGPCRKPTQKQVFRQEQHPVGAAHSWWTVPHGKDSYWSSGEGPMSGKFMKDCIPWVGPHAEAWEEHEEKEQQRWNVTDWEQLIPHSPCSIQEWQKVAGKLGRKQGSWVWEKRGARGRWFSVWFFFLSLTFFIFN